MNLYLFLSLIIVCVPFFSFIPNNKGGGSVIKYVTCCFLFFLLLFVGLRGDVDADYKNYLNMFNSVPNFQNGIDFDEYGNIHGEFLYLFFNSIFKFFNLTFSSFLLFVALLSFFLKYYVISQHVRNSNLSISLYLSFSYFLVEFVQIRWGLAISVGLLAIHFLNERRYIKSILLALAAGLIQSLAFIITPFVFIYSIVFKLITKNKIILILFIYLLPFSFLLLNVATGGKLVFNFAFYVYPPIEKTITTSKYYNAGGASLTLIMYYFFQYFGSITIIYLSVLGKSSIEKSNVYWLLVSFFTYIASLQFIFLFSSIVSQRINGLLILILSMVLIKSFEISSKQDKPYYIIIYVVMFVLNFYMTYKNVFESGALRDYYFSIY